MVWFLPISSQKKEGVGKNLIKSDKCFVKLNKPGDLKLHIAENMVSTVRYLKIEGILAKQDIQFLKTLANRYVLKDTLGNRLEPFFDLDLSDATIPDFYNSSDSRCCNFY